MLEEEKDDEESIHTNVGVLDEEEVADEEPSRDKTFPGQSTISFPSDNDGILKAMWMRMSPLFPFIVIQLKLRIQCQIKEKLHSR